MKRQPDRMERHPNRMKRHPERMERHPEQMKRQPERMKRQPEQMKRQPEQMKRQPEQMKRQPERMERHPERMKRQPERMKSQPERMERQPKRMERHPERSEGSRGCSIYPNRPTLSAQNFSRRATRRRSARSLAPGAPFIAPLSLAMSGILQFLLAAFFILCRATVSAHAQWVIEESHTTANLRGITNVGGGVAWASGTNGTVLRTEDGGYLWQTCAVPTGAEKLDFRGIQAFDENTAIVMSSGPGDQSRLYKTTDGCQTWKLLFTNPDKDGFWDAIVARAEEASVGDSCPAGSKAITGTILGDPAIHKSNQYDRSKLPSFYLANFEVGINCSREELRPSAASIFAIGKEGAFAASNSLLERLGPDTYWMAVGRRLIQYNVGYSIPSHYYTEAFCDIHFPVSSQSSSAGVFSLAIKAGSVEKFKARKIGGFQSKAAQCEKADMVAVGGDYTAPDFRKDTAAYTGGSNRFQVAQTLPGGYRSAVAYDSATKTWITVGPNGTDLSTDDGRNWRPLTPTPQDDKDADRNWNALSLPFVVGPHGRIGKLREDVLNRLQHKSSAKP